MITTGRVNSLMSMRFQASVLNVSQECQLNGSASQVDLLIQERKEAQAAAKSDESTKRQKEADDNAYLSLMPLALPAPTPPTNDFAGLFLTSAASHCPSQAAEQPSHWIQPFDFLRVGRLCTLRNMLSRI